ncbi:Receptor L-domain domain-containing protein [Caenorhabditis elegans]|uniref:Receptor L-domain domain-containing protein n=1 Tax=Caenorhabditis elegans TaxID=6239 RepID=A0A679L8V0_CAEEL|nr:Insulin/EGF-Receptor L Domain protein [Caenorhabditis elegans]CAA9991455.1 Insulin/EGF-Receptor L Domain protein [Caenorhabditis elegans]
MYSCISLLKYLFCMSILSNCMADRANDVQKALSYYKINETCVFNETEINSKTIKKFPKCDRVYGIIFIDSNTDLTVFQLKEAFKYMKSLVGGLMIEDTTNLTNLNIFATENSSFWIACATYGVFIRNNTQLVDYSILDKIHLYKPSKREECEYRIENNPKLDVSCEDNNLYTYTYLQVTGNLRDCGCQGTIRNVSSPEHYETCNTLYGGLQLNSTSNISNLPMLRNVITMKGLINIENTSIQDLSFFQSLTTIKYRNVESVVINLRNNSQMTRLGMGLPNQEFSDISSVYNGQEYTLVNFENLHGDFCLTISEVIFYFWFCTLSVKNFHAKLCDEQDPKHVICHFESLKSLPNNCDVIIGNLIIDAGDEEFISKVKATKYLIGTLIIRNTNLKKIDTLSELLLICSFNDAVPLVQIHSNKQMKKANLGRVINLVTGGERIAIIQDNHPDLFKSRECDLFPYLYTFVNLTYIGGNCGERVNITFSIATPLSIISAFILSSLAYAINF